MQAQAMRVYQIAFSGRDANGVLPMFTRVQAMTGKAAVRAFVERYQPSAAGYWAIPKTLRTKYRRRQKKRAATRRHEKSRR